MTYYSSYLKATALKQAALMKLCSRKRKLYACSPRGHRLPQHSLTKKLTWYFLDFPHSAEAPLLSIL